MGIVGEHYGESYHLHGKPEDVPAGRLDANPQAKDCYVLLMLGLARRRGSTKKLFVPPIGILKGP